MNIFSTSNILVHIPLGPSGYDLSWIEAIGTVFGLLCIWYASKEKIINYLFGLINVTLFAVIFFQIQLYASLLLQLFFFVANIYGWYAWSRQTEDNQAELKIRWLSRAKSGSLGVVCLVAIIVMTFNIDSMFAYLTRWVLGGVALTGTTIAMPELQPDAYPFWDSAMMVLSIAAMLLMTRKYVENWILWLVINLISVVIFSYQGVYFMALEYAILTLIALNGLWLWIKSAQK